MPRRNEQEYEDRRQRIIDGALKAFSRNGFELTTNRDIAEAAGIGSAPLIYHYFKDKSDLFRAVLEQRVPVLQLLAHPEDLAALPVRDALERFGRTFLRIMENTDAVALLKLILGEAVRRPQVAEMFNEIGPNRAFRFLAGYLREKMDAGTLRRADPDAAVRCFMGPLIVYVLTREVFRQPEALALDAETMLATHIAIFVQGIAPGE